MKHPKIKRAILFFLITVIGLILLAIALLNFPFSLRFVAGRVNEILRNSNVPIHINSISKIGLSSVMVKGVSLIGTEGDTIIFAGDVRASYVPMDLLKKRVILPSVFIGSSKLKILRNNSKELLNIVRAFPGEDPDTMITRKSHAKKWEVSLGYVEISNIIFIMNDSVSGIFIDQKAGNITMKSEKMSLLEQTIILESLEFKDASGTIKIYPGVQDTENSSNSQWNIGLSNLSMKNLDQTFSSTEDSLMFDIKLKELLIDGISQDIKNKKIGFNKLSLSNTNSILLTGNNRVNNKSGDKSKSKGFPWILSGNNLILEGVSFGINENTGPANLPQQTGLGFSNLDMNLSDIRLDSINAGLKIDAVNFDLNNGFSIKRGRGNLISNPGITQIKFSLETGNSEVNVEGVAEGSYSDLMRHPAEINKAAGTIKNTSVSFKDLQYFMPEITERPYFLSLSAKPISVGCDLNLAGSLLTVTSASLSQIAGFRLNMKGNIQNILNGEKTTCDIQFGTSEIDSGWVSRILKDSGIRNSLVNLSGLSIEGTISDSLKSPGISLGIMSNLGNISIKGSVDWVQEKLDIKALFDKIMIGRIAGVSEMGFFTGSASFTSKGFKKNTVEAKISLAVDTLQFKGYDYVNAGADCNISKEQYDLNFNIDDPSLSMNFKASLTRSGSMLLGKTSGSFRAGLNDLHIIKDSLTVGARLTATLSKESGNTETEFKIYDLVFETPQNQRKVNTITASYVSDTLNTRLTVDGDFLKCSVQIGLPQDGMKSLLPSYKNYLTSLIDIRNGRREMRNADLPVMKAHIEISYDTAFEIIMKNLHFRDIHLALINNSSVNRLDYIIAGREIKYKSAEFGKINVRLTDSSGVMNLFAQTDSCILFSHPVNRVLLTSHSGRRESFTNLSVTGKRNEMIYNFGISSVSDSNKIILRIPSGNLIMNRTRWTIDSGELLAIDIPGKKVYPELRMHNGDSTVHIFSEEVNDARILSFELKDVRLSSLFPENIIRGNPDCFISGSADYCLSVDNSIKVNSDLMFKEVSWSDLNFNNISLNGFFEGGSFGEYNLDISARLDTAEISLKGGKPSGGRRTISAVVKNFPVQTIQPFVNKFLSDLRGYISGDFSISTKNEIENITGDLFINDGNLRINALNTAYRMPAERIGFSGKKIILDNFKVLDSLNNKLLVNGTIDFAKKASALTDLEISASDLQIMNKKEEKNSPLYGSIFIDSRLTVKGPISAPVLKGKIVLSRGTDIYLIQKENLNLSESEQVLTFVSKNPAYGQNNLKTEQRSTIYNKTSIESVVEIDPATRLNIKLSKRMFNIDLMIQGGGEVNYNMLDNNQVSLTGKYEVSDGSADLKMIGWPNKSFRISRGGFIKWDGKLEDPELQFEALSKVRSSYTNPVDDKQRDVDFNVVLKLSNRLSSLDVLFTISTADQYLMSIINTLSPEEQMRQAITILLFEKVDLPGISTSSGYVTEQVNQLVASQLNQLTKTTIKGIDISFGLDTYIQSPSTGSQQTKTSLSYDVRKNLLNNRAQLEISGRLNDYTNTQSSSNLSLNNFSFKYQLDSSANKFIKVYNERSYEDVFEGEVIKTGVGFIYRKNYRVLSDIWRKEEKNKKTKEQKK